MPLVAVVVALRGGICVVIFVFGQRALGTGLDAVLVMIGTVRRYVVIAALGGMRVVIVVFGQRVLVAGLGNLLMLAIAFDRGIVVTGSFGGGRANPWCRDGPVEMGRRTNGRHAVGNAVQRQQHHDQHSQSLHDGARRETAQRYP